MLGPELTATSQDPSRALVLVAPSRPASAPCRHLGSVRAAALALVAPRLPAARGLAAHATSATDRATTLDAPTALINAKTLAA